MRERRALRVLMDEDGPEPSHATFERALREIDEMGDDGSDFADDDGESKYDPTPGEQVIRCLTDQMNFDIDRRVAFQELFPNHASFREFPEGLVIAASVIMCDGRQVTRETARGYVMGKQIVIEKRTDDGFEHYGTVSFDFARLLAVARVEQRAEELEEQIDVGDYIGGEPLSEIGGTDSDLSTVSGAKATTEKPMGGGEEYYVNGKRVSGDTLVSVQNMIEIQSMDFDLNMKANKIAKEAFEERRKELAPDKRDWIRHERR